MKWKSAAILCLMGLVATTACGSDSKSSNTTSATTLAPATTAAAATTTPGTSPSATTTPGTTPASVDTSKNEASDTGITKDTITIGLLTSVTGAASSTFQDTADGVNARVAAENAKGGINGRKIVVKVADDASAVPSDLSAAQSLVQNDKVFAVIGYSPYLFGSFRYLQQEGIPVIGSGFDGPEWRQQPNTNMFSWASFDPTSDANETDGLFWKKLGATTLAGVDYTESPSSQASIQQMKTSAELAGLQVPVVQEIPFGSVDLTATVLKMGDAKVDGATCSCVDSSNLAMMGAIKNAKLPNFKGALAYSGPTDNVFKDATATAAAEGNYFRSQQTLIIDQTNPAMQEWKKNLETYIPNYKGTFPTYGVTGGYVSADAIIEMLKLAGQNPTRKGMMDATRQQLTNYDASGILSSPVSFDTAHFEGTSDEVCFYYPTVKDGKWVDTIGKLCGKKIPNSAKT